MDNALLLERKRDDFVVVARNRDGCRRALDGDQLRARRELESVGKRGKARGDLGVGLVARESRLLPHRILETAAGTGILTRAINRAAPRAQIIATDINPALLEYAKTTVNSPKVEFQLADAHNLPFSAASFDLIVCQFGAMFFPDKVRAYSEAHRVLRTGGHFIFSVWDRISENEFADTITNALAAHFPADTPHFLARTPHGYHDSAKIRSDLNRAGFTRIAIEVVKHTSKASSPRVPATAYCQGTPLRAEIEAREPSGLQAVTDYAAAALAQRFGSDAVEGRIQAIVVTASG